MNLILVLAALSGAVAVAAGAFGAHGASGQAQAWLKTGGEYQLIHAVAALVAAQLGGLVNALIGRTFVFHAEYCWRAAVHRFGCALDQPLHKLEDCIVWRRRGFDAGKVGNA